MLWKAKKSRRISICLSPSSSSCKPSSLFLSSPLSLCGQPLGFLCVVEVSHRKNLTAKQAFSNVLLPYILAAIVISPSLSSRHSLPCSEFLRRACSHPWLPPWSAGCVVPARFLSRAARRRSFPASRAPAQFPGAAPGFSLSSRAPARAFFSVLPMAS